MKRLNGSHRNPNNPQITKARRQTFVMDALDKKQRRTVRTEVGEVLFENGLAVLPDDMSGKDVADELKAKSPDPNAVTYLQHRESALPHRGYESSQSFFGGWPETPWKKARQNATDTAR